MCHIRLQAPTLAKKCEISHSLPCGEDGRVNGRSDGRTVTCVQKFLGWIDNQIFLALGLRARVARALLQFFYDV